VTRLEFAALPDEVNDEDVAAQYEGYAQYVAAEDAGVFRIGETGPLDFLFDRAKTFANAIGLAARFAHDFGIDRPYLEMIFDVDGVDYELTVRLTRTGRSG